MCVGVAARLPIGKDGEKIWVLGKNRDRNYVPNIHFKKMTNGSTEYRSFLDGDTLWSEGINSNGIAIINTALMVAADEKAGKKGKKKGSISNDGKVIKRALKYRKISKAVKEIINGDVMGFTFVTNGHDLYVIENVRQLADKTPEEVAIMKQKKAEGKPYRRDAVGQKMTWYKVQDDSIDYIVRSNHGEIFSEEGYLPSTEPGKGSRARRKAVEDCLKKLKPTTIKQLIDCLSVAPNKDPEHNPIRLRSKGCKLFTTGQYVLNPYTKSFYYRPLDCNIYVNDKKVVPDDISDREQKTNLYVVNSSEEIKESISFKNFIVDDNEGMLTIG